jgi:signal peptidase I
MWGEVSGSQDGAWPAQQADPAGQLDGGPQDAGDDRAGVRAPDGQAEPGAAAGTAGDEPGPPSDPDAAPADGQPKRKRRSFWRELPILVVVAIVLAVLIKTFAVQAFWIPSGSMENTLEVNDRVLVNKIVYHLRPIHRGDIVVFNGDGSWDPGTVPVKGNVFQQFADGFASMFGFGQSGDILIKRVIGIPGDHVVCCNASGQITVNGVALHEQSYLFPGAAPSIQKFNIMVPRGRLWVMGDNRLDSADSRDHQGDPGGGTIPISAVVGRAFVIIWPPSRWRFLPIPATFTQPALNASNAAAGPPAAPSAVSAAAAQTDAAAALPARLEPSGQAIPLALGVVGAVPLTWLQRRVRLHRARRRAARRPAAE